MTGKPYEVIVRFPMSDVAHDLLDTLLLLPEQDVRAVTLALRAIESLGALGAGELEVEGDEEKPA